MNKTRKNILFSFIVFCFFFFSIMRVSANSIDRIDMDIYLDQNGNATITEVWKASLSQGTEGYRPYTGLGNSSISNFSVSDDSNKVYESLSYWNTNASFNDKAYKSGIHNTMNGVELCWGISSYGNRTYTLKYNISNFVTQYTDTQGIYFNFLKLDQNVGFAKVKIHSDIPFSLENAKIWAFGNDGSINFEDGSIVLDSGKFLSLGQYMVALIRFEGNLFNVADKSDSSFDNTYDSAFNGVTDSDYKNNSSNSFNHIKSASLFKILSSFFTTLFIPFILIMVAFVFSRFRNNKSAMGSGRSFGQLNFGDEGKVLPDDSKINYWREIPCNKDLERAYWICSQYDVVSEEVLNQGIIGAILLKWIKNEYISVSKTKKGLFSIKDNNYSIDFTNMTHADNEIERALFGILLAAAGSNKILEAGEFYKWSKRNYRQINSWFSSLNYKEQKLLTDQGMIVNTIKETPGKFGKVRKNVVKNVNSQLKEEAIQIKGLKKFLLDFSRMPEKDYFEVHIWEEYLIFAQLLGIADKVEEQFSKIYPNFNRETVLNMEVSTVVARNMARICYEGFTIGINHANAATRVGSSSNRDYSGSSRFSGGGGSSFSGGGGLSGGSSGGGFR